MGMTKDAMIQKVLVAPDLIVNGTSVSGTFYLHVITNEVPYLPHGLAHAVVEFGRSSTKALAPSLSEVLDHEVHLLMNFVLVLHLTIL